MQVHTAIPFGNALKWREEISKDVNFVSNLITAGSLLTVLTSDKSTNTIITFSIREVLLCICVGFCSHIKARTCIETFWGKWKLRRLFASERVELRNAWWKLHYEEVHNSCSLQNIITVIKSSWIKWGNMRNLIDVHELWSASDTTGSLGNVLWMRW